MNNLEASGGSYPNYNSGPPQTYKPGATSTSEILDETGSPGFPGFDGMEANNALGYTAALQEAGVPVTYTYISDVHDDQYYTNHGNAFGPGEAGHEAQLREYNAAFTAFFRRLARDGITKRNTLFLTTVDEGDHYDGSAPLNPGCNGVTTPCDYDTAEAGGAAYGTPGYSRNVGEVDSSLPDLLKKLDNNTTFYGFDFDDAPALIVPNQTNPQGGARPGPNDPTVRTLERDLSSATEWNPIINQYVPITVNMADETEETILHMVNSDPNREPTLTLFGDPSFYFQSSCDTGASTDPGCPIQNNGFAWNHGDIQPEIATTWQGWVGPGIKNLGETSSIWTDHTDARPTLMTLLGLHDDYSWDGAAIAQIIGSVHNGSGLVGPRAERSAVDDQGQRARLRGTHRGVSAARRAVRRVRAEHARCGHERAREQHGPGRHLHEDDLSATDVREQADLAGGPDPIGAPGRRERPGAGLELAGVLPGRGGRPPDQRLEDPGGGIDAAERTRLRLERRSFAAALRRRRSRRRGAVAA